MAGCRPVPVGAALACRCTGARGDGHEGLFGMKAHSARLALFFSCLGHAYMHLFTAFYFVIALSLEADWGIPNHELVKLWALGSLLVGLAALPAGWLGDRWSASGMMTVFFIGLGISGIVCGLVSSTTALMLGLAAVGLFRAIYHPVGVAGLATKIGRASCRERVCQYV